MDIAIYVQPHGVPCDTFFFFNDTATTEIYTLSLHDALPIYSIYKIAQTGYFATAMEDKTEPDGFIHSGAFLLIDKRSEEHTSELQSPDHLVCRLLLEKKKPSSIRIPPSRCRFHCTCAVTTRT